MEPVFGLDKKTIFKEIGWYLNAQKLVEYLGLDYFSILSRPVYDILGTMNMMNIDYQLKKDEYEKELKKYKK